MFTWFLSASPNKMQMLWKQDTYLSFIGKYKVRGDGHKAVTKITNPKNKITIIEIIVFFKSLNSQDKL